MDHFSTNLQLLRMALNLNKAQCAESAGFNASAWVNYENNHSKPAFADLLKIAKYFGVSLTQLVEEDLSKDNKVLKRAVRNQPPPTAISNVLSEAAPEYKTLSKRVDELERLVKELQNKNRSRKK